MTGAEKISDREFRAIMQTDLMACSEAFALMADYAKLRRQRLQMTILTLVLCGIILLFTFLAIGDLSDWRGLGIGLIAFLVGALVILRANSRLQRSLRNARLRWEQAGLQQCEVPLMKFATDLAQKVLNFNDLVDRLEELQSGDYWRDFRQLSPNEKAYIESIFVQLRGQLLAGLRTCRQLIDDPNSRSPDMVFKQMVSRDQEIVNAFTAKSMTSNHYVNLAKSLTALEADLQSQIRSIVTQA
jgi:hypothetical protein